MITTVAKAKTLWCPMDRRQALSHEQSEGKCRGPYCMMWRFWIQPPGVTLEETPHGIRDMDKKGYCGLAGIH
jgi:hypothetical protein